MINREITAEILEAQMVRVAATLESTKLTMEILIAERDALREVLAEIVEAYNNTYDAELDGRTWRNAASIEASVMERAAELVGVE